MKQKCPAELNSRVIRIGLKTYALLRELSLKLNLTMAEALDELIVKQAEPKAAVPMPIFFKPKAVFDAIVAFKPKAVSGNGVAHIKLKSIEEV